MADDAGVPGCIDYTNCAYECINGNPDAGPDAGSTGACLSVCSSAWSPTEVDNGQSLLNCITQECIVSEDGGPGPCQ
jgi:hypothetical protein